MSVERLLFEEEHCGLYPQQELFLKAGSKFGMEVMVHNGTANVCGYHLEVGKRYSFPVGTYFSIYSPNGCSLGLRGQLTYLGGPPEPMGPHVEALHQQLEAARTQAFQCKQRGPVVMVVGQKVGQASALCRHLLNYATSAGSRPVFVDLDVERNILSLPGTIGAAIIEKPAGVHEDFVPKTQIVLQYGHNCPRRNVYHFTSLLKKLSSSTTEFQQMDSLCEASGVIVHTGSIIGQAYDIMVQTAIKLHCDNIIVIGEEHLGAKFRRHLPDVKTHVISMVGEDQDEKEELTNMWRLRKIRKYFCGRPPTGLQPHTFKLDFMDVKIYRIGIMNVPDTCYPFGVTRKDVYSRVVLLKPEKSMEQRLFAISKTDVKDDIKTTHVSNYIFLMEVDMKAKTLHCISPVPKLPAKVVLPMSDITFDGNPKKSDCDWCRQKCLCVPVCV